MTSTGGGDGMELLTAESGYALGPADAPAWWGVGTYWRLLSTSHSSSGRSSTFDELVPPGVVAPPHVHENEEEAFFVLEGDLVFWLGEDEIEAPPGTYIYIPPGVRHGFRCNSPVGRVYNTLAPGGFDEFLKGHATTAPRIKMPPPGVSAIDVWRELDQQRPRAPWEAEGFDLSQLSQM
jgi:quercetin dioxygenase-like cupin family protein